MHHVAEQVRPVYLARLARLLRHLLVVGEGSAWLRPQEVLVLQRLAYRLGMEGRRSGVTGEE